MRDFKKLIVWEKSHKLVLRIYQITKEFPKSEVYGLTSQIRRACVSIPANLAEGMGRDSKAEQNRFIQIVLGSACGLEYYLILARDLGWIELDIYKGFNENLIEIKRMLSGLAQKIRSEIA